VTDDITYNLKSNLTVNTLFIGSTASSTTMSCGTFSVYGNQLKTDSYLVTHPGVTDNVAFWQVRIRYWLITIDRIDSTAKSVTTFLSNASSLPYIISIDNSNMFAGENYCN
jgi:hypothetical protein